MARRARPVLAIAAVLLIACGTRIYDHRPVSATGRRLGHRFRVGPHRRPDAAARSGGLQMTTNAIAWMDGALVAIDQRALPRQVRQLRITTVDEVIDAINTLAVRGAPTIGVTGAFGVVLAAFAHQGDAKKVELEAGRIASARPTAVNLAWSVHRVSARLPEGEEAVLGEALKMLDEADHVNRAAATHAADLVQQLCPDRPLRLLTHCNTGWLAATAFGTALGALRVLHARDAIEKVLVDETRPLMQGSRLTTWELGEAGIPHKLMIDSAAAWAMAIGQVDCVLVGADRICADGSVANEIRHLQPGLGGPTPRHPVYRRRAGIDPRSGNVNRT